MLQADVAGRVSVGVVDGLEAVEIDHQQRERLAVALRPRALLLKRCIRCRRLATPVRSSSSARSATSLRSRSIAISRKPKFNAIDRNTSTRISAALRRVEVHEVEFAADMRQPSRKAHAIDGDDEDETTPASRAPALGRPFCRENSSFSVSASGNDWPMV